MDEAVSDLSKLKPGHLPFHIFHEIARLVVTSTVVLIPYHLEQGTMSVLLTRRTESDSYYPSMLHPPGVVLLPTDTTINTALQRLIQTELNDVTFATAPVFVDYFFDDIVRGKELSLVFAAPLKKPSINTMNRVDNLPHDLISTDRVRLERVAGYPVERETDSACLI